jgi:preprotein translocase subunit SecG
VFGILLALLILDGILMGIIILLQSGKGGGLASMGGGSGTDTFIGGRQAATILTKATWVTAGLFLTIALVLSILSSRQQRPQSILRDEFRQTTAPTPTAPPLGTTPLGTSPAAPAGAGAKAPSTAPAPAPAPVRPKQ